MGSVGRNTDGRISEIRDYFLGCESELLEFLIQKEENVEKVFKYTKEPLDRVLNKIKFLINAMELGYFRDKNNKLIELNDELCSKIEKQLVLLMASIEDLQLVKLLEKLPDEENSINEL